jgi:hypothetical protein
MKAYLLGNGASIPYGAPLGSDLFRKAFEIAYDARAQDERGGGFYSLWQPLVRLTQEMAKLRGRLTKDELPTLLNKLIDPELPWAESVKLYRQAEALLAEWRIWDLFPEITKYYRDLENHGSLSLESKRLSLRDSPGCLFDRLGCFSLTTVYLAITHSGLRPDHYAHFAKAIAGSLEDTLVINLDYDNLLEVALKRSNGLVEHRLGTGVTVHGQTRFGSAPPKTIIFKPHGSFDYLYCTKCRGVSVAESVPVDAFQDQTGRKTCQNLGCGKHNLHNYFIPYADPTASARPPYTGLLSLISEGLRESLAGVTEMTAIGYSFPEADGHLDFIFKNRKVVEVVGKDKSDSNDISSRLVGRGINAVATDYAGFADYVRHMKVGFFED